MPRRRRKAPNLHGLNAKNYPKSVKAYVDYDYLDRLSPSERQWLSDFSDNHYSGDYRRDPLRTPKLERRKTYRAKNAANRDLYSHYDLGLIPVPSDAQGGEGLDWSSAPKALATEGYKAALAELRMAIDERPQDEHRLRRAEKAVWRAALEDEQ